MKNLRELQTKHLKGLLDVDCQWKALVYDTKGLNVLSTLFKVYDLREAGVTFYCSLSSSKQRMDLPCVYFIESSMESLDKLIVDIKAQAYESFYVNFVTFISREMLEYFAEQVKDCAHLVAKVYDRYLDFVTLDNHLFTSNIPNSFSSLVSNDERLIHSTVNSIVSSLFCLFVSENCVPIIRYSRGGASEAVASKLSATIKDYIASGHFQHHTRTLLILVDRNVDLQTLVAHSWSYQALVHDLFTLKLNRITVPDETSPKRRRIYDLDTRDFIWSKYASDPFPQVAEQIDNELNKHIRDQEDLKRTTGMDPEMLAQQETFGSNAKQLQAALEMLPELTMAKQIIDMHTKIALCVLESVKKRQLDVLFSDEQNLSKLTRVQMFEKIRDASLNPVDKLRFFIMYFLSVEMTKAEFQEMKEALAQNNCNVKSLDFIEKLKSLQKMNTFTQRAMTPSAGSTDFLNRISNFGTKITDQLKEGDLSSAYSQFMSTVKDLLPNQLDLPLTKTVANIMDGLDEDLGFLDPKGGQPIKQVFSNAVVYVVGGGNYVEYENLMAWVKKKTSGMARSLIYGASDMVNAEEFLSELESLSK